MKTLDLNGVTLHYKVYGTDDPYGGMDYYTEFYLELKTKWVKKYWLWGPLVERDDSDAIFYIKFDIEDPDTVTKGELREILERKWEMFNRDKEIKNGELI